MLYVSALDRPSTYPTVPAGPGCRQFARPCSATAEMSEDARIGRPTGHGQRGVAARVLRNIANDFVKLGIEVSTPSAVLE